MKHNMRPENFPNPNVGENNILYVTYKLPFWMILMEMLVQKCRKAEEQRLEEVGSRIRNRREEVDQEKRGRQVILTDLLPPAKRARSK